MNVPAKAAVDDATSEALARIVAAVPELMVAPRPGPAPGP